LAHTIKTASSVAGMLKPWFNGSFGCTYGVSVLAEGAGFDRTPVGTGLWGQVVATLSLSFAGVPGRYFAHGWVLQVCLQWETQIFPLRLNSALFMPLVRVTHGRSSSSRRSHYFSKTAFVRISGPWRLDPYAQRIWLACSGDPLNSPPTLGWVWFS